MQSIRNFIFQIIFSLSLCSVRHSFTFDSVECRCQCAIVFFMCNFTFSFVPNAKIQFTCMFEIKHVLFFYEYMQIHNNQFVCVNV